MTTETFSGQFSVKTEMANIPSAVTAAAESLKQHFLSNIEQIYSSYSIIDEKISKDSDGEFARYKLTILVEGEPNV